MLQLCGEQVLRVDNGLAVVPGLGAGTIEILRCLGGHDDRHAAHSLDIARQRGEGLDVGHAERAPMAAVIWVPS